MKLFTWLLWVPAVLLSAEPLHLSEILNSVNHRYPPWLIALIEQDIMAGRLRQSEGAFDLGFKLRAEISPKGYYDGSIGEISLEQRLPFWGANLFAGYRRSSGLLAEYDKERTQRDGELRAGLRFNLMRDGIIDRQRAEVEKARLDIDLTDPFIQRQKLDILRAATRAYFQWAAAGLRERIAKDQLEVAQERARALALQAKSGMVAPIVITDNERLIVSRQILVTQAHRRFEASALELSLFFRGPDDQPISPSHERLPPALPAFELPRLDRDISFIDSIVELRPEFRRVQLLIDKIMIDVRVARNASLPNLDLTFSVRRNQGDGPYSDISKSESRAGLEFRLPLQRNEAFGRIQTSEAELRRLELDKEFVRDRIRIEIKDSESALTAAQELVEVARRNVELSEILVKAEQVRFRQGASDLLSLQIREQALLEAQFGELTAKVDFHLALVDYRVVTAADLR